MENSRKPDIRFKGFTGEWEPRKLGDVCSQFEYGLNAAATIYDGRNKYIRITDIDDASHRFKIDDITSPDTNLSVADNYKLVTNDLLFARTGASVGKTYLYRDSDGIVYYAGFLIRAKINNEYNAEFIFQNTMTDEYYQFIRITSQRSGQPGVNAQEYTDFILMVPEKGEQERIGDFFRNLDALIALHERKCERLQNVKKSMLEKMFPKKGSNVPEIRFAGFTEPWEMRKLGDVCSDIGDGLHSAPFYDDNGAYFFINGNNLANGKIVVSEDTKKVSSETFFANDKKLDENTVLLSINGTIGNLAFYNGEKVMLGKSSAYLKCDKIDKYYLYAILSTGYILESFMLSLTGTTIKNLGLESIKKTAVSVPNKKEQHQIGAYFHNLDNLITLRQRELEKLKNIKKSMLEKMFV